MFVFDEGYKLNRTNEIFTVTKIDKTSLFTYKEQHNCFYYHEWPIILHFYWFLEMVFLGLVLMENLHGDDVNVLDNLNHIQEYLELSAIVCNIDTPKLSIQFNLRSGRHSHIAAPYILFDSKYIRDDSSCSRLYSFFINRLFSLSY